MSPAAAAGRQGVRTLVVVETVSLDGVTQAPASPEEDVRGGFTHGGWASAVLADDPEAAQRAMAGSGSDPGGTELLFGRRTYDQLVGHWLSTPQENPFTEVLRRTTKHVATRDPRADLPHPATSALLGEAAQTVAALKADGDGELVVLGSLALVRDLVAADLVDAFVLTTVPVVLGSGTRLFEGTRVDLQVERSWTSPSTGVVVATHRVVR